MTPPRRRIGALLLDHRNAVRLRAAALRGPRPPADWVRGGERPILLLPGVYETWHFLRPIGTALHADGHPVHVVPTLGVNMREIAWTVAAARDLLDELDLHHVVVVAHSKGGIVGKQLLIDELTSPAPRIDRLIAIASPFAGSSMARLLPVGPLRAFLPGDALLARLAAERRADTRITSIYPRVDPHVPEGSRLEGAENVEIDTIGHFRVLLDGRTLAAVREVVSRA